MNAAGNPQLHNQGGIYPKIESQEPDDETYLLKTAQDAMDDDEDYELALDVFSELASRKGARRETLAEAECRLGELYEHGLGVDESVVRAIEHYRIADHYGNAEATKRLKMHDAIIPPNSDFHPAPSAPVITDEGLDNLVFDGDEEELEYLLLQLATEDPCQPSPATTSPSGNLLTSDSDEELEHIIRQIAAQEQASPATTSNSADAPPSNSPMDNAANLREAGKFKKARDIYLAEDTAEAHYQLGLMYKNCTDFKNKDNAVQHLTQAADKGSTEAYRALAHLFYEEREYGRAYPYYQMAVEKDDLEVIQRQWLAEAANCLKAKDFATALALYLPLAEDNNIEALIRISDMYVKGMGMPRSRTVAVKYLELAYDQASATDPDQVTLENQGLVATIACRLGDALFEKDSEKAKGWYAIADSAGHKEAAFKMAKIYLNPGFFGTEEPSKIVKYLTRSLDNGITEAAHKFVSWYEGHFFSSKPTIEKAIGYRFYTAANQPVPKEFALQGAPDLLKRQFGEDTL